MCSLGVLLFYIHKIKPPCFTAIKHKININPSIVSVGVVEYNKHHHHGSLDDLIATRRASETLRNCKLIVIVYFCVTCHVYLFVSINFSPIIFHLLFYRY